MTRHMEAIMRILSGLLLAAFSFPASAQLSVTTFGKTDAAACYDNARNDFSIDVGPCDIALKDSSLSLSDMNKTLVNRGIILNRNGQPGDALNDFNEALMADSALAEAYLNRGNSYFLMSQYDAALADYEKALSLDVRKPWAAWYNIGLVHEAKKDTVKAREAYAMALEVNPDFSLAQAKLASSE